MGAAAPIWVLDQRAAGPRASRPAQTPPRPFAEFESHDQRLLSADGADDDPRRWKIVADAGAHRARLGPAVLAVAGATVSPSAIATRSTTAPAFRRGMTHMRQAHPGPGDGTI